MNKVNISKIRNVKRGKVKMSKSNEKLNFEKKKNKTEITGKAQNSTNNKKMFGGL